MTAAAKCQPPLIILGAGGHAKVLLALVQAAGFGVLGVCDPGLAAKSVHEWRGIPVLGGDEVLEEIEPDNVGLINGIGQLVGNETRRNLFDRFHAKGFNFPSLVHPAAWVAPTAQLRDGVQIMAGAVVQPDCCIGENSIVNTRSSIDHDCRIGAHVHIAPAATLCGGVMVADSGFVGSGATVIQGIHIGERAVVGAGVTLVKDLAEGCRVLGQAPRKYHSI